MKLLKQNEIGKLSFPDFNVENMIIDPLNKMVEIITDGGLLFSNKPIFLKSCKLIIKNWKNINVTLYQASSKKLITLDVNNVDKLMDICEFEYGNNIILRGFGAKTGQWIEMVFSQPVFEVWCE